MITNLPTNLKSINKITGEIVVYPNNEEASLVKSKWFCGKCEGGDFKRHHRYCEKRIDDIEIDPNLEFKKFQLESATIKTVSKEGKRFAKIIIIGGLEKVEMYYNMIMVCDTGPIDTKIEQVKKEKLEYENKIQTEMFKKEFENKLLSFDKRIEDLEKEKDDLELTCQDIIFPAKAEKIDDSKSPHTKIEFSIPGRILSDLNSAWELIPNYKLQLQPI